MQSTLESSVSVTPPTRGFRALVLATRPKTLIAAVAPICVGTALATHRTELSAIWSGLALLSALCIQIGTNFFNDAIDFKKGADTAERIGPRRATQSGWLTSRQVHWAGVTFFFLALLLALPLVHRGGWPIVAIGVASLICGYAYTGGPMPLAYFGLGDLFVLIFFGEVAVGGVYYLQTQTWNAAAAVAGLQVGSLATVLIAINNLRDRATDIKVRKRTLAVIGGERFSRIEISALALGPYLAGFYWLQEGMAPALWLPILTLPLALRLVQSIWVTPPSAMYNQFLGKAAGLSLLFSLLLAAGFALS